MIKELEKGGPKTFEKVMNSRDKAMITCIGMERNRRRLG